MTDLTPKTPYGFEAQRKDIQELSEGQRPAANLRMAPWLPIHAHNRRSEFDIAIPAGSLVAIQYDATDAKFYYVPANGGKANSTLANSPANLKYSTLDVGYTINQVTRALVTADDVGDATNGFCTLTANAPVGYTWYDWYHDQEEVHNNMQIQTFEKQPGCDWFIELPVKTAPQANAQPGDLVIPDPDYPGYWRPLNTTADAELLSSGANYAGLFAAAASSGNATIAEMINMLNQIVGRVWTVEVISDIDNLSKEVTYPGLGLTGSGSSGVPPHLRSAVSNLKGAGQTYRAKIMFGAFCS